jgi:hypothetical protein
MAISFSTRVSVPPDVLVQELAGEAVLLDLTSERYFGLDDVGTRMWKALGEGSSLQASYEVLLAEYDVDAEQLRRDLIGLVEQLVEHGLLRVDPA